MTLYDLGWKKSGRRDAIPQLVSEMIYRHDEHSLEKPHMFLCKLRRELKLRTRDREPVARQLLSLLPSEVIKLISQRDLLTLGLLIV